MSKNNFSLIDKATLVFILVIGIIILYFQYSDFRGSDVLNENFGDANPKESLRMVKSYLEYLPSLIMIAGIIILLKKPSKLAWRMTYIPILIFTLYFSYSVLYIFLSKDNGMELLIIKILSFGFLISVNLILILLSFYLTSNSFKEKLN